MKMSNVGIRLETGTNRELSSGDKHSLVRAFPIYR